MVSTTLCTKYTWPPRRNSRMRRLAQRRRVPLGDEGLDGEPLGRRRGDQRQVAQSAERHVQRARDRRGGEREHVHFGAQRLQPFLVAHAEAMFLVDDDEPEVLEAHVGMQQPVRGDDDVDRAVLDAFDARRSIPCAVRKRDSVSMRTGQSAKRSRKLLVCCSASSVVGTSTATCLPACARDERGAHRDLGLAEAHVAAHHAIHGLLAGEIGQHLADGLGLVGGFLEGKAARRRPGIRAHCAAVTDPRFACRCAYRSSSSAATSRILSAARLRALAHWSVPSLCSGALSGAAPE